MLKFVHFCLIIPIVFCIFTFKNAIAKNEPFGLTNQVKKDGVKRRFIESRILGSDARFRVITYKPNAVYRLTIPYDTSTYMEFESGEVVSSYSFNNQRQIAWDIATVQNRMYIRPIESDADTQVTVMTNRRVYFFELFAKEPEAKDIFADKDFVFYTKFNYPSSEDAEGIKKYATSALPNLDKPESYNFNYTMTGEETIFPTKIFDDGRFTYFEFKEVGGIMPAIFTVDSTQHEALANYRIVGSYVAIESINARFTLRYGNDIVCVYNETIWAREKELSKSKGNIARFDK